MIKFADLKVGEYARITKLNRETTAYRSRLIAMGLLPGTVFKVTHIAPFGDPIEIEVKGYALSLRKSEAHLLLLEEVF
jgi:ferrous iron transport protein A